MDRLAVILTDMLHSALTWEQNYGKKQSSPVDPLTGVSGTFKLLSTDITPGGKDDEHTNTKKK